jgi:5-methylcytosine-specific restriction endonuclease McrA
MTLTRQQRERAIEHHGIICHYCGKKTTATDRQIDHVLAQANHGGDELDNLVVACKRCNRSKGKKRYHQFLVEELQRVERHRHTLMERLGALGE